MGRQYVWQDQVLNSENYNDWLFRLDETWHEILTQLVHFVNEGGPFEGINNSVRDTEPVAFPTYQTWYTDSSRTKKVVEKTITRDVYQIPTAVQWKVYDVDGATILATATDTITYDGVFETSRTRIIT